MIRGYRPILIKRKKYRLSICKRNPCIKLTIECPFNVVFPNFMSFLLLGIMIAYTNNKLIEFQNMPENMQNFVVAERSKSLYHLHQ